MKTTLSVIASFVLVAVVVCGCGSGSATPQSIATPEQVNNIVEMRKLFDQVGGDWSKLTPDQQAAYTKLAGDDAKAQRMWKQMGTPSGPTMNP